MASTAEESGARPHDGTSTAESRTIVSLRVILTGLDQHLREWRAARHEGQSVLTGLSNTLLLRTYVDKGRDSNAGIGTGGSNVWGVLASAGDAIGQISLATEARVRRLHADLIALQDTMLVAATGIRKLARDAHLRSAFAAERAGRTNEPRAAAPAPEDVERDEGGRAVSVCGGYSVSDVGDCAAEVAEMLLKEALVTATIAHGVVACRDTEALTMYAAAWMMEPYVDSKRVKELQAMVGGARPSKT